MEDTLLIDGGKFMDGGMCDPGSGDGILCGISIHGRPRRWIGLAIFFGVLMASPVALAITIW